MEKTIEYYESAIKYNETLAEAAEKLAGDLKHPVVKKWCRGIGKQHRFHAFLHTRAMRKLIEREARGVNDDSSETAEASEELSVGPVEVSPESTGDESVEVEPKNVDDSPND